MLMSRRRGASTGCALVLVAVLCGCTGNGDDAVALDAGPADTRIAAPEPTPDPPGPEQTPNPSYEPPDLSPALNAELRRWSTFPVDEDPRPIVLMRPIVDTPEGFANGTMKSDFAFGRWKNPSDLPDAPARAGGYPIMSASEALDALRRAEGDGPPRPGPSQLTVRDVRLDHAKVPTDRGPRQMPVWIVRFHDTRGESVIPAIARTARWTAAEGGPSSRYLTAQIDPSDQVLTVPYPDGSDPCSGRWRVQVKESAQAVAIGIAQERPPARITSTECKTFFGSTPSEGADNPKASTGIQLSAPLGNRLVMWDGDPVEIRTGGPSRVSP